MNSQVPTGWKPEYPFIAQRNDFTARESGLIVEAYAAGKKDERKRLAEEIEWMRKGLEGSNLKRLAISGFNNALDTITRLLE